MHIVEETVKLLCEKSQRPHDDFDVLAMKLGAYGDTLPDPRVVTPSEHERSIHKMTAEHLKLFSGAINTFHAQPWYKRVWQALQGRIL